MREIKFRVWNKTTNKMIDDPRVPMGSGLMPYSMLFTFSNYEIMQYTGLKDKNGKEIYERDIVRLKMIGSEDLVCDVYFDNELTSAFCLRIIGGVGVAMYSSKRLEVIGNIYETPELLT